MKKQTYKQLRKKYTWYSYSNCLHPFHFKETKLQRNEINTWNMHFGDKIAHIDPVLTSLHVGSEVTTQD